jgi:putative transposase
LKYNADIHHRCSIRLKGYDYNHKGAYFVTICAWNRECIFGDVVDGEMRLNGYGDVAEESWIWLSRQYGYVDIDKWVVMPNHLHGIVIINDSRGGSQCKPWVSNIKSINKNMLYHEVLHLKRQFGSNKLWKTD